MNKICYLRGWVPPQSVIKTDAWRVFANLSVEQLVVYDYVSYHVFLRNYFDDSF